MTIADEHFTGRQQWTIATRRGLFLAVLGMLVVAFETVGGEPAPTDPLPVNRSVGQRLGNFTLRDAVSGRDVTLYGFAGKKAVVLVFPGTDCPLANQYAPRLEELNRAYRSRGVVFQGDQRECA